MQLWKPLRALLLVLLTIILTDPQTKQAQSKLDLWVLLDRSESTEDLLDRDLPEWKRILNNSKQSRRDELHFVHYASEVLEQGEGESAIYTGNRKLTRTNLALQNVLALSDAETPSRILLFTDGYATEPLVEAAAKLKARGIPLDYRLVREDSIDDFSIMKLQTPTRVQQGEPFVLGVSIRGHEDISLPLRIFRDGQLLTETIAEITDGIGKVEFTDRLSLAGAYRYSAEITPKEDAHPGNNKSERWIEVTGGPRILLVTKYTDDPVATALREAGFTVEISTDSLNLRVGQLAGTRAVILNNVPAFEMPTEFLDALDFYVREQGGGFLMVGGKQSFGSGGYFQSSIDALLPVSMELKSEHRKLSVALAIVMDRSGSMSMSAGAGKLTKMDLANAGAANAIELLGGMDQVAVLAVDSEAHKMVPFTKIGNKKDALIKKVRRIKSMGGGIYVYNGLKAGWDEIKKAKMGSRHIILFSDAADSVEEGAYKTLLAEIEKEEATVSVIGLGSRKDHYAKLLEDIATRGNGRIFFTTKPAEIPKLFAQETITIARSAFIDDPSPAKATGMWSEISPKPFSWLPQADGYNLSYAREDATTSLIAEDEYLAPLVATSRRGIGRTAAISFPLGGEYSTLTREWPAYNDFVQTMGRWLMGFELPPGLGLRHRLEGTRLTVDLFYDTEEWTQRFAKNPPVVKLIEGEGSSNSYEVPWQRVAPGHFSITRELEEGSVIRGAVQAGPHGIAFGPTVVGSSTEWTFDSERLAELRTVSRLSGGRELLALEDAWLRPPTRLATDLRLPLFITALVLILFEALITRMGWNLPIFTPTRKKAKAPATKPSPHQAPVTKPRFSNTPDSTPVPTARKKAAPQKESDEIQRQSRFDRAKRKR